MLVWVNNKRKLHPAILEGLSSADLEYIDRTLLDIAKEESGNRREAIRLNDESSLATNMEQPGDNSSENDSIPIRRKFSEENIFF